MWGVILSQVKQWEAKAGSSWTGCRKEYKIVKVQGCLSTERKSSHNERAGFVCLFVWETATMVPTGCNATVTWRVVKEQRPKERLTFGTKIYFGSLFGLSRFLIVWGHPWSLGGEHFIHNLVTFQKQSSGMAQMPRVVTSLHLPNAQLALLREHCEVDPFSTWYILSGKISPFFLRPGFF